MSDTLRDNNVERDKNSPDARRGEGGKEAYSNYDDATQDPRNTGDGNFGPAPNLDDFLLPKSDPGFKIRPVVKESAGDTISDVVSEREKILEEKSLSLQSTPAQQLRPLQTYRGDVEETIHAQKASVITIAAAQEERRSRAPHSFAAEPKRSSFTRVALIASAIFIVLGAALIFFLVQRNEPGNQAPITLPSFIFVDETKEVGATGLSREPLLQSLVVARNETSLSLGLVRQIYMTRTAGEARELLSAPAFLSLLSDNLPASLERTLEEPFMLGIHVFEGNQPFLIFKVETFDRAFSGMIEWEPHMASDLSPLFARSPRPSLNKETAPVPPARFLESRFVDRIVDNRDTRVLMDESGKILFLWTALDRRTFVLTTNEHTLREIISRLKSAPLLQIKGS